MKKLLKNLKKKFNFHYLLGICIFFLFFKILEAISIYYLDETKYEQKIK
jgi:hypothetical protein